MIINYKRAGFTLAEVLITLGIIGVVAAMTIPNLIANTRSSQYRSAFKKAVSTLSQAARMSEAQYGFDYAGINQKCGTNAATEHPDEVMSICAILNGTLTGATFIAKPKDLEIKKGSSTQKYTISTSSSFSASYPSFANLTDAIAYILADGTLLILPKTIGESPCTLPVGVSLADVVTSGNMHFCSGFIDVNGTSLPNKEVSCSSGTNSLTSNNCIVRNDAQHMTDIYPIRIHDGIVEPATAAARYVLKTAK